MYNFAPIFWQILYASTSDEPRIISSGRQEVITMVGVSTFSKSFSSISDLMYGAITYAVFCVPDADKNNHVFYRVVD